MAAPSPPPKQAAPAIENFASVMGMETREARDALQPGFWRWLMNFQPIGRRTLRALKGVGSTLYTAASTILSAYSYLIGTTQYIVLFLSDGSAIQVKLSDGSTTTVGSSSTFWSSGSYPAAVPWGNSGIIIVSTISANAYWAWDGTLYNEALSAGAAPSWLYGSNSTHTMPSGISGTAIEVYNSQAWVVNGRNLLASQPGCGNNFAASGGGVSFTATDSYVQSGYNALKQLDGYLYLFADAGVDVISDVQTTGSPAETTFLRTNVDPKIGTQWRDSVVQTPTSIIFSNPTGIYEVAGGATKKVSDYLDGLFGGDAGFTALTFPTNPSAFLAQISEKLCYGLTATITDIDDSSTTYKGVVIWDGQRCFLASQENDLDAVIGENNASQLTVWGASSTKLYPAFNAASSSLTKKAKTWLSSGKSGIAMRKGITRLYAQFSSAPEGSALPSLTVDTEATGQTVSLGTLGVLTFINNSGGTLQFQNNSSQNLYFVVANIPLVIGAQVNVISLLFGLTFSTTLEALDVVGMAVAYDDEYSDYS